MKYHVMLFVAGELRWLAKEYGNGDYYISREKKDRRTVGSKAAGERLREIAFELEPSWEIFLVVE